VQRLRSPDGECKEGKAFPEEMLRRAFSNKLQGAVLPTVVVVPYRAPRQVGRL